MARLEGAVTSMSPREYLEFLQLAVRVDEPGFTETTVSDDQQRTKKAAFDRLQPTGQYDNDFEEFLKQHAKANSEALQFCSKYEDPAFMSLVISLKREIENAMQQLHFGDLESLVIGTLPSGEMNALAVKVPDSSEYVIALNQGIFTFLNLASKCLAQTFVADVSSYDTSPGYRPIGYKFGFGWKERLKIYTSIPSPVASFKELFAAYLLQGDARLARPFMPEASRLSFYGFCTHVMEVFTFAHEVAHVIEKHGTLPGSFSEPVKKQQVETYWREWKDEFRADVVASEITMKALESQATNWPPILTYASIQYLFFVMEFVDRANNIVRLGQDRETLAGSHPPASLRRHFLETAATRDTDEKHRKLLVFVAKDIGARTTFLWRRTRSTFLNYAPPSTVRLSARRLRDRTAYVTPIAELLKGFLEETEISVGEDIIVPPSIDNQPIKTWKAVGTEAGVLETKNAESPDTTALEFGTLSRKTLLRHIVLITRTRTWRWFAPRLIRNSVRAFQSPIALARSWHRGMDVALYSFFCLLVGLVLTVAALESIVRVSTAANTYLAVVAVIVVAYPLNLVSGLSHDGSILHSVEVVWLVLLSVAFIFEMMNVDLVTFAVCGALCGHSMCPFLLQWVKGRFVAEARFQPLTQLSVVILLGIGCGLVLGSSWLVVARKATLASMILGCVLVNSVSVSAVVRSLGITMVMVFGSWGLLATLIATAGIEVSHCLVLLVSVGLALSGCTEAMIAKNRVQGSTKVRSAFELMSALPRRKGIIQLAGFTAIWSMLLMAIYSHLTVWGCMLSAVLAVWIVGCFEDIPRYLLTMPVFFAATIKMGRSGANSTSVRLVLERAQGWRWAAPLLPKLICQLAEREGIEEALQCLVAYSAESLEERSIELTLRRLLQSGHNAVRVFGWVVSQGWGKSLVAAGRSGRVATELARLLFFLKILDEPPYDGKHVLQVKGKGKRFELESLEVGGVGDQILDSQYKLRLLLDDTAYESLCIVYQALFQAYSRDLSKLSSFPSILRSLMVDPTFAGELSASEVAYVDSVSYGLTRWFQRPSLMRGQLASEDRDWLKERYGWSKINTDVWRRSVVAAVCQVVIHELAAEFLDSSSDVSA